MVVRVHYPLRRVRASLGCEWTHIPSLYLTGGYAVWASPSIVAVIVDIDVVAGRRLLADVLDRGDDVERLPRR